MTQILLALVGGLILGWVIEWVIDWTYWRRGVRDFYANEAELTRQRDEAQQHAEQALREREEFKSQLEDAQQHSERSLREREEIVGELEELRAHAGALQEQLAQALAEASKPTPVQRDDLEQISGIGPVFEKRLFEAGIESYEELAELTPEELQTIVKPAKWQQVDFSDWIQQAKDFARLTTGDRPHLPLERIKGIGPVLAAKLSQAGVNSFADLAQLDESRVRELVGDKAMYAARIASWLEQAKAIVQESEGVLEDVQGENDA